MDTSSISSAVEVTLRSAGYQTWPYLAAAAPVICFEDDVVLGFVHIFDRVSEMLGNWEAAQNNLLNRHAVALRSAGDKAWNVYSVFLATERVERTDSRLIDEIEENFSLTRKIMRGGVFTAEDVVHALLPLLPIQNSTRIEDADFAARLRNRSPEISDAAIKSFLGPSKPAEVAQILLETSE